MASALKFPMSEVTEGGLLSILSTKLCTRQQNIAGITEMIHVNFLTFRATHNFCSPFISQSCYLSQVASLIHNDVLDDADTRRGVSSLNLIMGNKVLNITLFAYVVYEVNQT
jgi:geranyl diphosphate synthase